MSVKAMGHVWDLDMPANKKFVLLAYVDHADHDGTGIFPSEDRVAYKTGYSRRQVQRITDELEAEGYLIPDGQGTNGTHKWRFGWNAGKKLEAFQSSKKGRQNVTPKTKTGGDKLTPIGVTNCPQNDVKMSPESSYEPSIEPSSNTAVASAPVVSNPPLTLLDKPKTPTSKTNLVFDAIAEDFFGVKDASKLDKSKSLVGSLTSVVRKLFEAEFGTYQPDIAAKSVRRFAATCKSSGEKPPIYKGQFEPKYLAYIQRQALSIKQALQAPVEPTSTVSPLTRLTYGSNR